MNPAAPITVIEALGYLALALFAAVLIALALCRRRDPVDAEAGVAPDRAAGFQPPSELPTPDLLATQCATCRAVRCADQRWLPEVRVPLPAGCRVSHGLCPACYAASLAEADRVLAASPLSPVTLHLSPAP